ncbi:Ig-like domain-containing protein [Blastopirellula marina]|nr:Ig-like domain-containing protein [Blastopirellula marina]
MTMKNKNRMRRAAFHMGSERLEERRVMDASAPNFDLSGIEPETAYVGDQYTLDLMAAGGTTDGGQFTFVLDPDADQTPAGASITPDGVIHWTPSMDQVGSHTFYIIGMNQESPMKGDFESITIDVQLGSPTVDLNGADADGGDFETIFQYSQGPVSVADSDMTVADPNNETLMSATVSITNLSDGDAESLSVDIEGTSITAEYAGGVLQLTGEASVEEYQQVLRSVRYNNTNPSADVTPRVIEFTVNDGVSDSEVATSTVSINLPPNLESISDQTVSAGEELMFEITATDPNESDELSFMIDPESPSFVSLIQEVGSRTAQLLLTPGIDVPPGAFSISILVFDNAGLADVESFFVEVLANEAPVSVDDAYETTEDAAINIPAPGVLDNDSDPDGDPITVVEVNGESASVGTQVTLDSGALLTLNEDGSFDYDPNGAFASLVEGETAEETFTYTIADSAGQLSTSTVLITIAGVNSAPVSTDDAYETTEDTALSIGVPGVLENDTDADGDSLTVAEVNGEAASVGTQITLDSGALLTLNADGSFDYDPNGAFASLPEGETAEDSFTYAATDGAGLMSTSTVVISIAGVNNAPVSADDFYETTEDTAINISAPGILENDSDADGDSLTVVSINGETASVGSQIMLASGALLTLNADGSFDFDPNGAFASLVEGESADESFTYTVQDGSGLTSSSTVLITVNGVNNAPVSEDDAYETTEDMAINIAAPGVLGNDVDADGDELSVVDINGETAHVGTQITLDSGALLTLNADGSFDYDPNGAFAALTEGESAEDSFTYTAADASGLMSTSTVVISIAGVNNAPVSADDAYETAEDTALNIAAPGVLGNDVDADGDSLTVVDINGEAANVGTQITLDSGALLTLNADGSFDYDPNGAFASLAEGETAEESFTYAAADASGLMSSSTVVITVAGVNNAPTAADDYFETAEDVALNISAPGVLGNDSDADGDSLTVVDINGEAANVGVPISLASGALLTLNADGSFDYDPNGAFAALADGETGEESFTYTAADASGLMSTATVIITVNGVNNAPVTGDDAYATNEDAVLSISSPGVLENDTDADGDSLTVVDVNGEAASIGTQITLDSGALLTLNADGSFDYDPNGAFASLAEGETAEESFTYSVADASGLMSSSTVAITISGVNNAPVSSDDAYETTEDAVLNISAPGVLENDTDADGDSLTVVDINGEAANIGTQITLDSGALLTLNADGSFDYDPNGAFASLPDGETAEDSFTYTAADASGLMSTSMVVISVNGVNNAPVSSDDAYATTEDEVLSIGAAGVLENDTDADGDSLTVADINGIAADVGTQISLESGALLTLNADGSFDYDPNGAFASLAEGEAGADSFTYSVADASGLMSTSTVSITINGVNTGPVSSDDSYETTEDSAINIPAPGVLENDADADGDSLSVVAINGEEVSVGSQIMLASGALLTVNSDGSFDFDPNGAFASLVEGESADESFTYTATDGSGLTSSSTVLITVNGVDHAPVSTDDAYATTEDAALNVSAPGVLENDADADGDELTVVDVNGEATNVGSQITLDSGALLTLNADGSFDYDPNGAFASLAEGETAEESFTYSVADAAGMMSSSTVVITISGVNNAPVTGDDAYETTEDVALNISSPGVLDNDTDADGDALTVVDVNGEAANVGTQITLDSGALLTLNADGSFDYDPNGVFASLAEGETAEESFTYSAADASGLMSTSTVVITIAGVNNAPVSLDDVYTTTEDELLSVVAAGVLNNDTDADGDSLTVVDINGEAANVGTQITLDSGALLTLNADGSFDYDPNGAFAGLAEGETAEESFTYSVADASGLMSTSTVAITITGVNHAPEAAEDAYETSEGAVLNVPAPGVLANDTDADGDPLTVVEMNGEAINVGVPYMLESGAMLTLNADGSFDYDPNGAFASLGEGETGEDRVTYAVADSTGLMSHSAIVFTIFGVDNAPVTGDDGYSTPEDAVLSIATPGVLDNDADADGDSLTVVEVNGEAASVGSQITLASGALLTLNADGSFDYDPNGAFMALNDGETAEDSFTYTAADGSGLMSSSTVAVTIEGVTNLVVENDEYSTDEDSSLSISAPGLLGNDIAAASIVDINGEAANIGATISLASGALLTVNADGSFDYDPNGSFEALGDGESTLESFTYTATNGDGTTASGTVTIVVNGVNDAPLAADDDFSTDESTALSIVPVGVLFNDTDAEGSTLAITAVNGATADVGAPIVLDSGALLTLNADGSFDYDPNGVFDALNSGESATDSFTYTVSDGSGGEDTATVTLTINGVDTDNGTNLPPLNSVPGAQSVAAGQSLVFGSSNGNAISVSDPDANGAFVQVTVSVQHGTLQVASLNASRIMLVGSFEQISSLLNGLVYTPNDGFVGTDTFTINSNDRGATGTGNPRTDIDTFDIVVTPSEAVEEVFADSELLDDMLFT